MAIRQIEPLLSKIEIAIPKRNYTAPLLSELLIHTSEVRWLKVFYRSEHNRCWLQIKPSRAFTTGAALWDCKAYSQTHGEERTFRVDRMDAITVMDSAELTDEKKSAVENHKTEPLQEMLPVRIVAGLTYRGMLRAEHDEHIGEFIRAISDEEWEVDFMFLPRNGSGSYNSFIPLAWRPRLGSLFPCGKKFVKSLRKCAYVMRPINREAIKS